MAQFKAGQKDKARKTFDQAVVWMNANRWTNQQLPGHRAEAARLLGIANDSQASIPPVSSTGGPRKADVSPKHLPGWGDWFDPDNDCDVVVMKEKLQITVPAKPHDYSAELKRWNAPLLLTLARDDFIVDVKVGGKLDPGSRSSIPGRLPYQGVGLLLLQDRNNYVTLSRAALSAGGGQVRHSANFELRKGGTHEASHWELELDPHDTYLRVVHRGDSFYALASHDGVHWRAYDAPLSAVFSTELRVGIVAVNSSDQPLRCTLEGFAIRSGPGLDEHSPAGE
jgi:hypothetical protein